MSAAEVKDRANDAYRRQQWREAVTLFGEAIDLASGDAAAGDPGVEVFKIYSNRCAAYMQMGQYANAIQDARRCTELSPQWTKGWLRLGDALLAAGEKVAAYNAFNAGLREVPGDAELKSRAELAARHVASAPPPAPSAAPAGSSSSSAAGPAGGGVEVGGLLTRGFALVNALMFVVPVFPWSRSCYRNFMVATLVNLVMSLARSHGLPRFSMDYLQRVMLDPTAQYVFLCVMLLSNRPYLVGMAPLLMIQTYHFSKGAYAAALKYAPSQAEAARGKVEGLLGQAMAPTHPRWGSMAPREKDAAVQAKMLQLCGTAEVAFGVYLLVELVLPTRNLLMVVLYWQLLQMRATVELARGGGHVTNAFRNLDARILGLVNHRMAPSFLRGAYQGLREMLRKQVQRPDPSAQQGGGGPGGLMSRCSVM